MPPAVWGQLLQHPGRSLPGVPPTSMCRSSSCSSVTYLSSLRKGLLRLVVKMRMPGLAAPWLSMNFSSSSL